MSRVQCILGRNDTTTGAVVISILGVSQGHPQYIIVIKFFFLSTKKASEQLLLNEKDMCVVFGTPYIEETTLSDKHRGYLASRSSSADNSRVVSSLHLVGPPLSRISLSSLYGVYSTQHYTRRRSIPRRDRITGYAQDTC